MSAGNPWVGDVKVEFGDECDNSVAIGEAASSAEVAEVRWYIEEFMDFPEGGNVVRAKDTEQLLVDLGCRLWDQLNESRAVRIWLESAMSERSGRIELNAAELSDEVAFRTPWELMRVSQGESRSAGFSIHQLVNTWAGSTRSCLASPASIPLLA